MTDIAFTQEALTLWGQTIFSMAVATYLLIKNTEALKQISTTLNECVILLREEKYRNK